MSRLTTLAACTAVGMLFALGVAAPAAAHTSLIDIQPGEGEAVAEGTAVTLTFDNDLLTIGAEATVTDAAGVTTTLEVTYPTAASTQVVLPALAEGEVTIAWRVVAGDGHPIEGALVYTAEAPAAVDQEPASANPTASPRETETASPSETPSPTPSDASASASADASANDETDSEGGPPVALWIAIFAALLGSSAAIIAGKRRS